MLLPFSCAHSSHNSGEDDPYQQAKKLMALAHCKQPSMIREREHLSLRHIKKRK